ncbi:MULTISPECIES: hypothetical protein [Thermomonosporaceae]|uniref:hypothetical protein n=1 Tax=Thermomonosporaceae TaxID=2012 RepID=UPI00255B2843|nr:MULTISPECIES: hypothetical protein [Thermomonosporaceae]MDL4774847.1 hypothetical protein [Actinomadura xylanilytica]
MASAAPGPVVTFPELTWNEERHPLVISLHRPSARWMIELGTFWQATADPAELRSFAESVLAVAEGSRTELDGPLGTAPRHHLTEGDFIVGRDDDGLYLQVFLCDGSCGSPTLDASSLPPAALTVQARALLAALPGDAE